MMKHNLFVGLLFHFALGSATANAQAYLEQITGEITTFGNPEKRDTYISEIDPSKPIPICAGKNKFLLTQLGGTVCTIYGNLQPSKKTGAKCFLVDHFKVDEISRGKKAFVGELKEESKNKFTIIGIDQSRWALASAAPGVVNLKNSLVVADLVASGSSKGEQTWLVARIFGHPTP